MSSVETVLLAIGGPTVLLGVLAFLTKGLLNNWISKDLERYKDQISAAADAKLEQTRSALSMLAHEHAVKATEFQTRRAKVVGMIYALISDLEWESSEYASLVDWHNMSVNDERYKRVNAATEKFYRYFNAHRIYLPEAMCEQVRELANGMVQATNHVGHYLGVHASGKVTITPDHVNLVRGAFEHFAVHAPEARRALEREFRAILGDS